MTNATKLRAKNKMSKKTFFLFVSVTQSKVLMHRRGIDNCLLSTEVLKDKGNSLHKVHVFLEDIDVTKQTDNQGSLPMLFHGS